MSDYFEQECAVCRKKYLTDGADATCSDPVCEATFERSTALHEVTVQAETALRNVQLERYAGEMGV